MDIREVINGRLYPSFVPPDAIIRGEEDIHPWLREPYPTTPRHEPPLNARWALRVYDEWCHAQPNDHGCILAGSQDWPLDSLPQRERALQLHVHLLDITPNPLISAETSASRAIRRARDILGRAGRVRMSLINTMVRVRAGLPVLSLHEEMLYYGVEYPDENWSYYCPRTEILYPYVITKEEIVATWDWSLLDAYLGTHSVEDWVRDIIQPAVDRHERSAVTEWEAEHGVI